MGKTSPYPNPVCHDEQPTMIHTSYTTRQGWVRVIKMTREEAEAELVRLDAIEQRTRELAPTNSGDVRFNYCEAAKAIRAALAP